ncbi:MAG TPA: cobalamin-dependent protein [Candidatus Aquilonibacter sp.]
MMSDFEVRRRIKDPLAALPFEIGTELLSALRNAIELGIPEFFIDVATWAQSVLVFRDVAPSALALAIDAMRSQLPAYVPVADIEAARKILGAAKRELGVVRLAEASPIDETTVNGAIARRYLTAILEGEEAQAAREVLLAVAGGMKTLAVYAEIFTPALQETGRLWQRNEISVSQEHIVTAATERLMAQLVDLCSTQAHRDLSVVTATLGTSQHQVGTRMVSDAFSLCGWQSSYLGATVPVEDVLAYVDSVSVDVLTLSATLARDLAPIQALIAELETLPLAPLVIVGGRAFSLHPSLWRKVGADGYAHTPLTAVALANELVKHNDAL